MIKYKNDYLMLSSHIIGVDDNELKIFKKNKTSDSKILVSVKAFKDIVHIKTLEIYSCEVDNWNSLLVALPHLKTLRISECNLELLPSSIYQLPQLEELIIDRNNIQIAPSKDKLLNLRTLDLCFVDIDDWEALLASCPNLEELTIDHSNLQVLPTRIGSYSNLKRITITHCSLQVLPARIGSYSNLERITIAHCSLQALPDEIGLLKKLLYLSIKSCALIGVPSTLSNLDLTELNLSDNKIRYFPKNFKAPALLNISSNPLTEFPEFILKDNTRFFGDIFIEYYALLVDKENNTKAKCRELEAIIRKLTQMKATYASKKQLIALFLEQAVANIDTNYLFQALSFFHRRLNYIAQQEIMHRFKSLKDVPLESGNEVIVLGKLKKYKIKELSTVLELKGIQLVKKVSATTSHVVLCTSFKNDLGIPSNAKQFVFLTEEDLNNMLLREEEHKKNLYLKNISDESTIQNLKALLLSNNEKDVALALEMIETGGLPAGFQYELLLSLIISRSTVLRRRMKEQLSIFAIHPDTKKGLQYFRLEQDRGDLHSEAFLKRKLKQYFGTNDDFRGDKIAKLMYESWGIGYRYILEETCLPSIQKSLIESCLRENTLDFSDLKELIALPAALIDYSSLEVLNLEGCSFKKFPTIITSAIFPNLKTINLKKNPIRSEVVKKAQDKLLEVQILHETL